MPRAMHHSIVLTGLAMAGLTLAAPASAQQNPPARQTPAAQGQAGLSTGQPQFVAEQQLGEWRASQLVGLDVLGANGEKLGDVRDALVASDGRISTVVIGVGGVLGVGEDLVGVPFTALEFASRNVGATRNPETNSETARTGAAQTTGSTQGANTGGISGANAGVNSARDAFVTRGGTPSHVVLRVTKAQMEAAPKFVYAGRATASGDRPQAVPGQPGSDDPPPATRAGTMPSSAAPAGNAPAGNAPAKP